MPVQNAVKDFVHEGLVHYEFDDKGMQTDAGNRREDLAPGHATRLPLHAVPPKPGTHGPQVALYDRCLQRWGARHDFMAFIDTDEFLVLRDGTPDLPTLVSPEAGSQALLACCPAECLGNVGCSCQQCRRTSILPLLCSLCCAVEGLHGVWWPGGQLAGVW